VRNNAMQKPMPMHRSPRCGARTRSGRPCRSPAVRGRTRCRMHGGRAGAPRGNRNAFRHGHYTAEAIAERREVRDLIWRAR
jgi:glucans biosynthesis protein